MRLHLIAIAIIVLYLLSMILVGWFLRKKTRASKENYLLAGKSFHWYYPGLPNASGMFAVSGTMWMVTRFGQGRNSTRAQGIIVVIAILSCLGFLAVFLPWELVQPYLLFTLAAEIVPHFYGGVLTPFAVVYAIPVAMASLVLADVIRYIRMPKKQLYVQAFAMYGLRGYFLPSGDESARKEAIRLYDAIDEHRYDRQQGGYRKALARDWKQMEDIRLSEKDANEPQSMNTHLHVLEAYTALYRIWPDEGLKEKIRELIYLFLQHILSAATHHLVLFFDDAWLAKSNTLSYGHNIEAAGLLQEAAAVINDEILVREVKKCSVQVAGAATEGLDKDGSLGYVYDADKNYLVRQKHWWPQAAAMVGFCHPGKYRRPLVDPFNGQLEL